MRSLKFASIYRGAMLTLALLLLWSLWAGAQVTPRPALEIVEPQDGARFLEGTDLVLRAEPRRTAAPVDQVTFFANGRRVGVAAERDPELGFSVVWTNVPRGIHTLTAEAVDEAGAAFVSSPIKISVRESMGRLTFGLDSIPVLQRPVLGNPMWQYIASLIYIILAFYISKFLDFFVRLRLKRLTARTDTRLDDMIVDCIKGPIKIVVFVVLLHIGLRFFDWDVWVQELFSRILLIIVAVSITYMTIKFVDVVLGYWRSRAEGAGDAAFDRQLFPIISKSLKVFVVMVAVLVTSQNLGLNITGIIASLSIGGLALGLAAQDTLGNLFGAVSIFIDKPFRVGDRIQLEGIDGVVETIGMRSTRVRNLDGHLITVPNKTMGNATITNVTLRPNIRTLMNIGLTYDTPVEKVRRAVDVLNDVFKNHPMTHDVWISFNKFEDASLNIFVIHWWKSTVFKDYLAGMQEINLAIKKQFDAERIDFAFPTQTLYLRQDSDWRIRGPSDNTRLFEDQKS